MEIRLPASLLQLQAPVTTNRPAPGLRVGEILAATVLERVNQSLVKIALGTTVFRAQTQLPLEAGQKLQLQVLRAGTHPLLQPLRQIPPTTGGRETLLRTALPQQQSLAPLLANLRSLTQGDSQSLLRRLPPVVAERIVSTYRALPGASDLAQPGALRQAVENSGTFFEQRALRILRNLADRGTPPATRADRAPTSNQARAPLPNTPAPPPRVAPAPASPGSAPSAPTAPTATATESLPPTANSTIPLPGPRPPPPSRAGLPSPPPPPASAPQGESAIALATLGKDLKLNLLRLLTALSLARDGLSATAEEAPATATPSRRESPLPAGNGSAPGRPPPLPPPPPMRGSLLQAQAVAEPSVNRFSSLGDAVEQIHQQTRAAVARMELSQLSSLPDEAARDPAWLVELPVRHKGGIDLFQLRIERRDGGRGQHDQEDGLWSVTLAFDLAPLGPLHARIVLCGERVSTTFWAERENTAQQVSGHLHQLRERFDQVGLQVDRLDCHRGTPPAPKPEPPTALVRETA